MKAAFLPVTLLLCSVVSGYAMQRPSADQVQSYRADGTLPSRLSFAAGVGNNKLRPAAAARLMHRLRASSPAGAVVQAPPPAWQGMPTIGSPKIFILLIDFSDYNNVNSSDSVHAKIFGAGAGQYPYESLKNYYDRSSYGLLTLQGATLGWYNTFAVRSNISTTTVGREGLIEDALDYFDAQGHDFTQYDNDADGVIDYFAVIWTGPDTGWGSFWWAQQRRFEDLVYTVDGKTLGDYSWQWESYPADGGTFWPRVLIHETGHALGLPDYYDYDDTIGPDGGVGGMDMMDANIGDHNAFSKFMLGWLAPVNVSGGSLSAALGQSDSSADAVKVMPDSTASGVFEEFFMLQNRVQSGNDLGLPGSGIAIWHVDARLNGAGQDFLYDNSYTSHKLLRLMEADGLEEIENGGGADAGDLYLPLGEFSDSTTPNSRKYNGGITKVFAQNIGGTAATRTLDCGAMDTRRGYVTPTVNLFRPLAGGTCRLDVTTLSPGNMTVKVYTLNGGFLKTIYDGPSVAGTFPYFWSGDTAGGATVASGLYLVRIKGPAVDVVEKVVLIR